MPARWFIFLMAGYAHLWKNFRMKMILIYIDI